MNFEDGLYGMYREVDELSLLNKLFVSFISEKLNVNNYKTNTTFVNKNYLIDILSDYNYGIDDYLDDISNLIKIKKGYPIYKLEDIELISIIKTQDPGEYKENLIINKLHEEINSLVNLIKDIVAKLDFHRNYETISVLSNISFQLKKFMLQIK